ncbi:hypothetical protein [Streptomyces sp. NPDC002573]|uniref:hypothetical protein n=1 Tax=Streptomyces sp. NPDC002573 TaxID=3364651 RepID=UPI0036C79A2C
MLVGFAVDGLAQVGRVRSDHAGQGGCLVQVLVQLGLRCGPEQLAHSRLALTVGLGTVEVVRGVGEPLALHRGGEVGERLRAQSPGGAVRSPVLIGWHGKGYSGGSL